MINMGGREEIVAQGKVVGGRRWKQQSPQVDGQEIRAVPASDCHRLKRVATWHAHLYQTIN